jgi:site-specific DNA-methyltransferase (adenine-specific)
MTSPIVIERNGVKVELHHGDCLPFLRELADGAFNLAIVDPPWGINASRKKQYHADALTSYEPKQWDDTPPTAEYFTELRRVAKDQIIWGSNYFTPHLPPAKNWIVWDKLQPEGVSFSMHELAFYSGDGQAMMFRNYNGGNRVANNDEKAQKYLRIHPTQKPVELYSWILANYAQPGREC